MTTTVNLRKLLHRKSWEMCTPSLGPSQAVNTAAGSFVACDKNNLIPHSLAFFVAGVSACYRYDGDEDAWIQLPNSGATGAFAAGACGEFRGLGAMGGVFTQTATAGTTNTLTTNRTIVRDLKGRRIRVVAGTGVGYEGVVSSNTLGANAVITVNPANGVAFDATTQYQVYSGSLWFFNSGTVAVGFSVYDIATNTWTARSVTGLPTAWGTDGQLVSTIGSVKSFAVGTASAGAASTLTNSTKNWLVNGWANYQVRITAGTGKGQIRTIASNTATVLTVSAAWTVVPDATSVYSIEGNDDTMYLLGNNAVTMYRFTVSTNTWATLAPTAARAGAAGAGFSANWIDNCSPWDVSGTENAAVLQTSPAIYKQNGRYILSFRGGGSNALDVYDIAANTWISGVAYGYQNETLTTGSCSIDVNGLIYIQKEATGRILKFDCSEWTLQSFAAVPFTQGAVLAGQKMFMLPFSDGGTTINFLYTQIHTDNKLLRMMVV